jgi:integrase
VYVKQQTTVQRHFLNSLSSEVTRHVYTRGLRFFCRFIKVEENNYDVLLEWIISRDKKSLESAVIDYILYLKEDKKLAPYSVSTYLNPIRHFFKRNDIVTVNWGKVKKFQGKKYCRTQDRPYTREEILRLLEAGTLRDKIMILLMSSGGLRVGALSGITLKDLTQIDGYNLFQIKVYAGTEAEYITFCTPETRKYIQEYLDLRTRYGERLIPNSPLLRKHFNTSEPNSAAFQHNKGMSYGGIRNSVLNLLHRSGVRSRRKEKNERTEVMMDHALRKYFATSLETDGVNPVYIDLLLGHDMGLKSTYSKPSPMQLLEGNGNKVLGYIHGIDALTINEDNILRKKIQDLDQETKDKDFVINSKLQEEHGQVQQLTAKVTNLQSMLEKMIENLTTTSDQKLRNSLAKQLCNAGVFGPENKQR